MKKNICFFTLTLGIICCSTDDKTINGNFEFVNQYTTQVTVGGFVGIKERIFEKGEIYKGIDEGKETIKIRIAEHSELNEKCANSWCYQEFLNVPRKELKFLK